MLVTTFPLQGLKYPADCIAAEIVEGLVSFKVKRLADKCVGCNVRLLVTADVCASSSESSVSKKTEDWQEYKED